MLSFDREFTVKVLKYLVQPQKVISSVFRHPKNWTKLEPRKAEHKLISWLRLSTLEWTSWPRSTKGHKISRSTQELSTCSRKIRHFCRKSLLSKLSKIGFKRLIVVFNPCKQFFTLMAKPFFSTYSLSSILVSLFVDYTYAGKNEFKICFLKEK